MPFPSAVPSARSFAPGDWPIKQYKALSGAEIRIRYGNYRSDATLDLSFENIPDDVARRFLDHFNETTGTFSTFTLPAEVFQGWGAASSYLNAPALTAWRYAEAPQISNVFRGRSTVQVKLVAVL